MIIKKNHYLFFGFIITALVLSIAIIGFFWTPNNPNAIDSSNRFASPSTKYPLGTDNFGRCILSRVVEGIGATVLVAVFTLIIGFGVGLIIGTLTGYYGGWVDELLMRSGDVVMAFPSILLALVFISITGTGRYNVIIALGVLFIPSFARVVRGEFVRIRELDFVHSAKIMGAGPLRIMLVHILPNAIPVLLRFLAIGFNNAVLAEASMSYLGLGVQPPDSSLGRLLSDSQPFLFTAPWYALSAGVAIVLLILGFSLISEGIVLPRSE
ncbi:MAG: ABC transporter permease [Oscillospiraceae bacterium]|nr:ABC transporter permease [Oscillospiraceae bacterium]